MTNERAAKIVLDFINAGEAEYRNFSVEEIIAFKKAYVALNPEPVTNADRIRAMTDEELAEFMCHSVSPSCVANCSACEAAEFCYMGHVGWLDWLKKEVEE